MTQKFYSGTTTTLAKTSAGFALAFAVLFHGSAMAGIIVAADEVDTDVRFDFRGSIDLSSVSFANSFSDILSGRGFNAVVGQIQFYESPYSQIVGGQVYNYPLRTDQYESFAPIGTFGTGAATTTTASGDLFAFNSVGALFFENGYNGGEISGSMTFANSSLESLGLVSGVYRSDFMPEGGAEDFLELRIGQGLIDEPTPAPAPATLALLGLGLLGLRMRRKA